MMISPKMFIDELKDASYEELIIKREELIREIRRFEKLARNDKLSEFDGPLVNAMSPDPEVRYQMYLEYLSELCKLMSKKYNLEYVWGNKSLCRNKDTEKSLLFEEL